MTREEIEEDSRKIAFAESLRPSELISSFSEEIQAEIRTYIYLASRESYIIGYDSRDEEIAELVELLRRSRHRMNHYSDYIATEWRKMADRVLKKYEQ